jgi:multicomponent Na+:H+ antiporter subunit E
MAATGAFTPANFIAGFGLGLLVLYFTRRAVGAPEYITKVRLAIGLVIFFLKEMMIANLRVAYEVLTPRHNRRPGVVAVPLDARTDAEITLLANLITLTPGTLSLDVSADRSFLYVHAMYVDDVNDVKRQIKDGFERRLLEVMR